MRDFFCFHDDNENEAVEAHIPRHRDSKTKKPRHQDLETKTPQHQETETNKPQHCDSKAFLQIPRLKNLWISRFQDQKSMTSIFQDQKVATLSSCRILTLIAPDINLMSWLFGLGISMSWVFVL